MSTRYFRKKRVARVGVIGYVAPMSEIKSKWQANVLVALMKHNGEGGRVTIRDLSIGTGITERSIQKYRNGQEPREYDAVKKIATFFNVLPATFFAPEEVDS